MTPNDVTPEERYGFFKMFDHYASKEGSAAKSSEGVSYCDSFSDDNIFTNIGYPQEFCKKFKYLYIILRNSSRAGKQDGEFDNNDCAFLNYWLNNKLRGVNSDTTISIENFYQKLKAADKKKSFESALLDKKLYNIEKHDLENMRKLYDLYNIKSNVSGAIANEMGNEESVSCLTYTKECFEKYRDAIINCRDGCTHFYSVLTEFKKKFEDLSGYTEKSISCKHKELFELPDYGVVIKEHESVKIIRNTTISVLFLVFGVFFMLIFSDKLIPISQQVLEKIKSTKNMLLGARERSNELLSYTSDNDNIFGDHEEYSIRYYSIGNY
ncbi:PIR Superfamily Protein [Plasmodium ovale curtisi]|uniref:PIR Superfamily Protein n=1 Tax=Plasmodium ovale curtisi TaxID=864141 RepID=A0A1A8X1P7_PLAOA|nr:PIR Superfamily Protein [Plasmodium ovale curtisi]SBS99152.1 PIR Superfamily Protein [Plasmodium ovale curtisi]